MGCGASSANKAVEPQILAPVPNSCNQERAFIEQEAAKQPAAGPGGVAEQPPEQLPEPLGNAAQDSPNSSKRSGAATPVFEASWKGSEAPMLGAEDDEQDCDQVDYTHIYPPGHNIYINIYIYMYVYIYMMYIFKYMHRIFTKKHATRTHTFWRATCICMILSF
jgi:hypothetical protein